MSITPYHQRKRDGKGLISFHLLRENRDLASLSSLGHFLKGSSATLGLTKVKDSCEKIQHYGANKDEMGTNDVPDNNLCLERIGKTMVPLKRDYSEAESILKRFYHE